MEGTWPVGPSGSSPDDGSPLTALAAELREELWAADPLTRSVRIWQRDPIATDHRETGTSDLLGLTATAVADQLDRPEG